jgi:hypothetical protein
MGNYFRRVSSSEQETTKKPKKCKMAGPLTFHDVFPVDSYNGLYLNNVYFPEEIVAIILSFVDPKDLLRTALVCKRWCNIIKSDPFWATVYNRHFYKKPKKLPWYVYYCALTTNYFDQNLIKNGNGQEGFRHWKIIMNYGDEFRVEDPPSGSDELPSNVPEFYGKTSCFATSYYECNKLQEISFENNNIMQLILDRYKPHIEVSEWFAGRFDCGCVYNLWCKLYGIRSDKTEKKPFESDHSDAGEVESDEAEEELLCFGPDLHVVEESDEHVEEGYDEHIEEAYEADPDYIPEDDSIHDSISSDEQIEEPLFIKKKEERIEQWAGSSWTKVEFLVKDYPTGVRRIIFQHEGRDTQFWKGHYGSKMAGGVLRILFDTIEP